MSGYCNDCGTKLWQHICPNCDEELAIETFQGEFIEGPRSEEWEEKVAEQQYRVGERIKNGNR